VSTVVSRVVLRYRCFIINMSTDNDESDVAISARVSPATYAKIVERQQELKRTTGVEASLSQIIRSLVEKGLEANGKRR